MGEIAATRLRAAVCLRCSPLRLPSQAEEDKKNLAPLARRKLRLGVVVSIDNHRQSKRYAEREWAAVGAKFISPHRWRPAMTNPKEPKSAAFVARRKWRLGEKYPLALSAAQGSRHKAALQRLKASFLYTFCHL